jgi:hypothetical protein
MYIYWNARKNIFWFLSIVLPGCPKSYTEVTVYLCVLSDLGTLEQDTEIADNTGCIGILFLAVIYFSYMCNSLCRKHVIGWEQWIEDMGGPNKLSPDMK